MICGGENKRFVSSFSILVCRINFFLGIPIWKMVQETSLSRDYIEKLTHDLFCIEIGEDENLHLFRHVSEIIHESKGGSTFSPQNIVEIFNSISNFYSKFGYYLGYLNGHLILPKSTTVKFPIYVRISLITEEFGIFSAEKRLEKERFKQMHPNLLHINMGKKKKDHQDSKVIILLIL